MLGQDQDKQSALGTTMNKLWQDPEYRAKHSAAVSTAMKKLWQDPEYRAKHSAATTAKKQLQNILGDYVVHIEHGIARFAGVTTFSVNGSKQRYLVLVYADGKLYVPTDQIRRVKRYKDGDQPPLSRLNQPLEFRKGIYQRYHREEKNDPSTICLDSDIP